MNIILCIVDTLRYDYIRAHGANDWIQTPNLDRLASKSLIFDHAYAASYPTIPHRTDLMTGEYGWSGHGPFHPWMPLRFNVPTLPRLLADADYATQLIHDTPHLVNGGHAFDWPFAAWTPIRGAEVDRPWIDDQAVAPLENWASDPLFDFVGDDAMQGGVRRLLLTYSRANRKRHSPEDWNVAQLFDMAAEFLKDNARRGTELSPFFLWLDCFDPHEPWDAPPDFVKRYDSTPGFDGRIDPRAFSAQARRAQDGVFPAGVRERQIALYAAKVSWVDHCFGKVLQALEATGLDQNTAIVLTADHGTNLGERGGFGKTGTVNEQEAHVPLLIHVPGGVTGRSDRLVQPQDITTTILSLAGVAQPGNFVGHDLVALQHETQDGPRPLLVAGRSVDSWQDDPAHVAFTVFNQEWYLNVTADPDACRLFRYGSVEDVASRYPEVARDLREAGLAEIAARGADPKLVAWLRSGGTAPFPSECCVWPGPPEWYVYWERVYIE